MNDLNQSNPGGPPPLLVAALRKILRPLIRLMLSHQITYPTLINLLKSLYVEVAEDDFQVNGKRQSDSRINLLTGVHRKDVKRLREEAKQDQTTPSSISVGAQLIGLWLGSEDYTDEAGNPKPLPLRPSQNNEKGFDKLIELVCKQDIRPRVILDEWLRLGVAHVENDHVILNTGAFTPEKGFDEKVFFFGKNTQDHISAGSHNLLGLKPSHFDRSVYYDKLSKASVDELNEQASSIGMQALTEMNKLALAMQQRDASQSDANYRMNFGIFNFNTVMKSDLDSRPRDDNSENDSESSKENNK